MATKRQGAAAPPAEPEPNAAMEQAKADLAAARASKEAAHTLPIHAKLAKVQAQLRVAKNRGKGHNPNAQVTYEYRNSEDILATVKPLCAEVDAVVVVDVVPTVIGESVPVEIRTVGKDRYGSDIFAMISGPRFAAVATAMFVDVATGASVKASAFAFIDSWRKGQTEPEKRLSVGSPSMASSISVLSSTFLYAGSTEPWARPFLYAVTTGSRPRSQACSQRSFHWIQSRRMSAWSRRAAHISRCEAIHGSAAGTSDIFRTAPSARRAAACSFHAESRASAALHSASLPA